MGDPLAHGGVVVLDGGLATELEARGHDLSDDLWSARLLRDDPGEIEEVHLAYFRAGAQVAITASYQASFEGFAAAGIGRDEAAALMRRSVELAGRARDRHLAERGDGPPLLVAGSVGPYGAMLADGQEYVGHYGVSAAVLAAFHRPRMAELVAAGADLLAIETIPSVDEAAVLVELLGELPGTRAWISYSCRGEATCEGTPFAEAARVAARGPGVIAVGVNCSDPADVEPLLRRARTATDLPLVAYPNDGRVWDGAARCWHGVGADGFPAETVAAWRAAGARYIGGCCGVGPAGIRSLAAHAA